MCVSLTYPFVSGIEIPPCNVSSEAQSRIKIYCRHRCHRCSLNSLDLSNFFKPNEQKDLDIFCDYYDYYSYPRLTTVDIVPDFWTVTPSISHLNILQCNMSMLSLLKLVVELKPQSLSLGSLYEPITLFPVIHQTENCISLKEVRDGLRNIAEFKYDAVNRPIDKTMATFLKTIFSNTPFLKSLTLGRCNGSEIIDLIETDMPSVTYLELIGPDITPNVIQCVGNRMKGLENIHIYSIINGSIRKRCSTEETPLSNVTSLSLHYSGVFRAIDSKLDMPNLQTLSISGLNGSDIVALFNTDMPFVTSLRLDRGADITPDIIQCIGNRMKGLKDIYISSIIYNSMRKECSVNSTPISNVISLTLHYSEVFQPMDSKLNMPNLQTLSISGLNGSEIVDLIHTDMPSVTCLELTGPDITSDVIQCVGNRMKGLENIHIHSKINGSIRKRCSTEETPLSNVTSLSLHYSGVFQAVHLNFNMPNLITLTISGITSDVTIASTMKGLEHLNIYIIIEQVYLCSNTKDVFRNIKNTSLKMFIFSPPGRLASQPYGCEVIDLSHNGLKDLGRKTFSNAHYFEGVRYLDASFNNISTLYEGCFIGLNNLEELDVSWNHIINISSAHMAELHNLRVLCLAHNELRTLNQGCFEYLTNLEELDVSWNGITHINSSYFAGLHKLQVLILSHNELKTISECLSELIYFSNEMTTLDMSHNFLSSDYSTRCKMTKLQRLYLQNNDYSSITEIVEIIGFDIKYINLSSNPVGILELNHPPINKETLEKISNDFSTSDEVIILRNLRYSWTNSITLKDVMTRPIKANAKITPWLYFQWLLSDKYISQLKHSPIVVDLFNMSGIYTTINATEALLAFPVMNHFSFNLGDQIYCGCEYISTYVMLNVLYKSGELTNPYYKNNWTCKGPWEFAGIPLLQAPQRMFKDCWQGNIYLDNCCVYYKQIYTNKHTIDCSTCGIKNLPLLDMYEFFSKVEVILMSNNQIDDLCETDISRYVNTDDVIDLFHFSQPSKVEVIDFRNNSLESICDAFFKLLNQSWYSSLRKIDLRQNQLITLSKYVLNNRFNLDFIILLAGNRFLCTCDNIWLKDWIVLQPDEMLPDLKSVECRDRKGNLFINMKVSELNCNTSTMSVTSTMWQHVTIGLATTVGILILIAVYLYRVKNKIKVWIYMKFGWHPLDKGDNDNDITDMDYDAFISYSHQDLVWVRENLVDFLQSDNLGYTVCLHERDWPVGVLITENILLSVKHSRRMIMVLSENYLNSEWCRMEFQAAHREMLEGRTKYLIMIAMEGFPLGQLPPEMDFYIKTHTYLEAESNWFKEKLIYAMPETPLTKIRELRSQTNVDMELEVRAISRRRFPALFYRIFIYRDGRGELQQDEEIIVENEEIGEATVDIENDEEETVESEQIDKDVENDP